MLVTLPTCMQNFKKFCQGEVCKTDKPSNFIIETLIHMTPGIHGKSKISFWIWNSCNQYRLVNKSERLLSAISVAEQRP